MAATACSLVLVFTACGDDGSGPGVDAPPGADASGQDATPDAPPAPDPAGDIAVIDLCIANPGIDECGAAVSIAYPDTVAGDVEPVVGTNPPGRGECAVWVYEVGVNSPAPGTDQGEVTIDGTLSPVGTCAFDETLGEYVCSTGGGTLASGTVITPPDINGAVTLLSTGAFANMDLAGARVSISGFNNEANNGVFIVLAQDTTTGNTLTILNPAAVMETLGADGAFSSVTGAGPTPANRDFLGTDANTVSVAKADGADVGSFSRTIAPSGQGLVLGDSSALTYQLPIDPVEPATFTCDGADNGVCGPNGTINAGFVIQGVTTDADITGLQPDAMPPATTRWARFLCNGQLSENNITLSAEAIQALIDSGATRIQTQLYRVTSDLPSASLPFTTIVAGHGLIGYTDVPQ